MQFFETLFSTRRTRQLVVCIFLAACVPVTSAVGFSPQSKTEDSQSRSIGDYRADLKTFMKLSKDEDPQLERNAIYNLCQLHYEITIDSRFETSQQLQGIRAVIAKRLGTFSKDEENKRLRKERESKKSPDNSAGLDVSAADSSTQSDSPNSTADIGSETGYSGGGTDNGDSDQGSTGSECDSDANEAMIHSAYDSAYSMGAFTGGPNQLFGYAGRFGPPWDHGEALVDLITSVINPSFWRRNGGVGSIHYYQPSRVLVIRATQQGNEEVGDLLERLRANGGPQLNIGGFGGAIGN